MLICPRLWPSATSSFHGCALSPSGRRRLLKWTSQLAEARDRDERDAGLIKRFRSWIRKGCREFGDPFGSGFLRRELTSFGAQNLPLVVLNMANLLHHARFEGVAGVEKL